jgi:hypothetical protein
MFKKYKNNYYLLSEETPVTGDFVLTDNYGVWKFKTPPCTIMYWGNPNTCKKILKSTDLYLEVDRFEESELKQLQNESIN